MMFRNLHIHELQHIIFLVNSKIWLLFHMLIALLKGKHQLAASKKTYAWTHIYGMAAGKVYWYKNSYAA